MSLSAVAPSRAASPPPHSHGFSCTSRSAVGAAIIAPKGELDLATAALLEQELLTQSQAGLEHLVVDLRGLTFMDSSGLGLLARWRRRAVRDETRLSLIPGPPSVQRVLELTNLADLIDFVSEDELATSGDELVA